MVNRNMTKTIYKPPYRKQMIEQLVVTKGAPEGQKPPA